MALLVFVYTFWDLLKVFSFAFSRYSAYCFRSFLFFSSRLELIPQLKKDGTPQIRTPSRFALFVKENFARIKKGNEAFSHQDVMRALSSEFAKLNT